MLSLQHTRIAIFGASPVGLMTAGLTALAHPHSAIDVFDSRSKAPLNEDSAPASEASRPIPHDLMHALSFPAVRYFGNVTYGADLSLKDLRSRYDAIVFAPPCIQTQNLLVRGMDLPGVFDGSQFLRWHRADLTPDIPWPLEAQEVAVIGADDSALQIAQVLATRTPSPDHRPLYARCIHHNPTKQIHIIAPNAPAQAEFSLDTLQALNNTPHVDLRVEPSGLERRREFQTIDVTPRAQVRQLLADLISAPLTGAPISVRIHLCHRPHHITGQVQVTALHTHRCQPQLIGPPQSTGEEQRFNVQAVYSSAASGPAPLPGLSYDYGRRTIPTRNGRVYNGDGGFLRGVYTSSGCETNATGLMQNIEAQASLLTRSITEDLDFIGQRHYRPEDDIVHLLDSRRVRYVPDSHARIDSKQV